MNDAEKLKLFREKYGFKTQLEFAQKLGFDSASTISNIENGSRPISKKIASKIKELFNIDIKEKNYRTINKRKKTFSEAISTIGKRLSKIQIENDLTDREISNLLEISERRYEKLIEGKEKPYFDEIMAIAENFDVSLDWLILNENAPVQEEEEDTDTNLTEQELKFLKAILKKAKKTI